MTEAQFKALLERIARGEITGELRIDGSTLSPARTRLLIAELNKSPEITSLTIFFDKPVDDVYIQTTSFPIDEQYLKTISDALMANKTLTALNFPGNLLINSGNTVQLLLDCIDSTNITELDLSGNCIGPEGLALLAHHRLLGKFTRLNLSSNFLGAQDKTSSKSLLSTRAGSVEFETKLSADEVTEDLVKILKSSNLRSINLSGNRFNEKQLDALFAALTASFRSNPEPLKTLELADCFGSPKVPMKFLRYLLEVPGLSTLNLANNHFNLPSIRLIIKSLINNKLMLLASLDLSGNTVGLDGVCTFSQYVEPKGHALQALHLANADLDEYAVEALRIILSKHCSELRTLNLSDNPAIGSEGFKKLAPFIQSNRKLTQLNLCNVGLDTSEPKVPELLMTTFAHHPSLAELNLARNRFRDSASQFAKLLEQNEGLQSLCLNGSFASLEKVLPVIESLIHRNISIRELGLRVGNTHECASIEDQINEALTRNKELSIYTFISNALGDPGFRFPKGINTIMLELLLDLRNITGIKTNPGVNPHGCIADYVYTQDSKRSAETLIASLKGVQQKLEAEVVSPPQKDVVVVWGLGQAQAPGGLIQATDPILEADGLDAAKPGIGL